VCIIGEHWWQCTALNARFILVPTSLLQYGHITSAMTTSDGQVWSDPRSFCRTQELISLPCWRVMLQNRSLVTMTWQCGWVKGCRCMSITAHPLVTIPGGDYVLVLITLLHWLYVTALFLQYFIWAIFCAFECSDMLACECGLFVELLFIYLSDWIHRKKCNIKIWQASSCQKIIYLYLHFSSSFWHQ